MAELLRALRLGAVNIFGVAIPGFLLLFISCIGFLLPMLFLVSSVQRYSLDIDFKWYDSNKWLIVSVIILISYIAGFILRLTSPHELDKVSVKHKKSHIWNYEYEKEEKETFPYSRLKSYFNNYGHPDLAKLVTWDPPKDPPENEVEKEVLENELKKCSSTVINRLKLDIALDCPGLSAFVDSQEAHIRLMSGTWLAIRATTPLVLIGTIICLYIITGGHFETDWVQTHSKNAYYCWLQLVINAFLLMAMWWGRHRIQELFHWRRVNELLIIFHAKLRCEQQPRCIPESINQD